LDRIKYIGVGNGNFLSLGGEVRERYEYTDNPVFGQDPQDEHGVFLQRYILHGDLHLSSRARVFAQLLSALENGRAGGPSPVDENKLALQQAFADIKLHPAADFALTLRGGRQEVKLGSGRLVDVREGPNVRRTFDGARTFFETQNWRIDGLALRPVESESGIFDDETSDDQALWGLYAVGVPKWLPAGSIDVYYLGYKNNHGQFSQGTASETRHSIGLRYAGVHGAWDFNWETLYQFGSFGSGDIEAWTLATDTGYTWHKLAWQPRIAINTNIASGDRDPSDPDLQTFNPLFPRGNYFSEAAVLGPFNFYNLHPFLTVTPHPNWTATADLNFFWRLETSDGVYSPSGDLIRLPGGSDQHFVTTALSLNLYWQISRHFLSTAIYSHLEPQAFLRETGSSDDIDFFELTLSFLF
jgi:hypothetical protein